MEYVLWIIVINSVAFFCISKISKWNTNFWKKKKKKVIFPSHEKACNFNEMVFY